MFCTNCGANIADNSKFCGVCGAQQTPVQPVAQPVVEPVAQPVVEPVAQPAPAQPVVNSAPAADNAHPGRVSFFDAIKRVILKSIDFKTRASKSEFWWGYLFLSVASLLSYIPYVGWIFGLATVLPSISVTIRRFNDVGVHWKNIFKMLIPVYGVIFFIKTCLRPSVGDNEFGPGPR